MFFLGLSASDMVAEFVKVCRYVQMNLYEFVCRCHFGTASFLSKYRILYTEWFKGWQVSDGHARRNVVGYRGNYRR